MDLPLLLCKCFQVPDKCSAMPKCKHVQLSIADKLKIIENLEKGVKPAKVSLDFGIAKQTISDIKRSKEKLKKYSTESSSEKESGIATKKGDLERMRVQYGKADKLEEALMKWYRQQIGVGVCAWGRAETCCQDVGAKNGY